MKCNRCGKENPAEIHTCTPPLALRLADYWERRAQDLQTWVDENDYVEFGYRPEGLKREQAGQRETAAELRRLSVENETLRSDPAYDYCRRLAIMLECMALNADGNFDAACALLDEYSAARDRWAEAQGQPYVSGFGKD